MTPIDLYRAMSSRYFSPEFESGTASPHELFAALEFEARFLALLSNSVLREGDGPAAPRLGRAPGLGEWVAYLRQCEDLLDQDSSTAAEAVRVAVNSSLAAYDGGIEVGLGDLRVPKKLRDHLSHGGPLPPSAEVSGPLGALISLISRAIEEALEAATLELDEEDSITKVRLLWDRSVSLWPFVFSPNVGEWCLFSRATARSRPAYMSYGTAAVQATRVPDGAVTALAKVLVAPIAKPVAKFQGDVCADLAGFMEDGDENLRVAERDHGFEIYWKKATGTGEGFEERRDYFRLGPDDVRQWRSPASWVPYSEYLREIANWPLLARRIRLALDETNKTLAKEESTNLGWPIRKEIVDRPARVVVTDMDGSDKRNCSFVELLGSVDEDLEANRARTQVVFINGEAGIGKTRAMISAARARAEVVERASHEGGVSTLPLLLYVGSTGQVLSQLDQVVAAAVATTRSLTASAVKALCRNGLIVLLVDGFDELLGNVRYNDALGSLQPWLEDLGGRGVMVVSARSSYYLGQYKASVERAQDRSNLAVHHRIAEIQRWTMRDVAEALTDLGIDAGLLDRLSDNDRALLGLPFFARAFAEMCLAGNGGPPDGTSLADHLIDQYLAREEAKVVGEAGSSIISREELRAMFRFVAELMDENSEREADDELLRTAAMFAIEDELDARGGLSERLPALCGFSVDVQGGKRFFRFQHELFFDQFLGDAVAGYAADGIAQRRFHALISSSVWRPATIERIERSLSVVDLERLLATRLGERDGAPIKKAHAAANVGSLWLSVIRRTGRMNYVVRDARFVDVLDLSSVEPGVMNVIDSEIEFLALPGRSDWAINLSGSSVKKLRTPALDFAGLNGVISSEVMQILTKAELIERADEIRAALTDNGAGIVDPAAQSDPGGSENAEAAEHFLRRAIDRGEYYWVLQRNYRAADDDVQVKKRTEDVYGRDVWLHFVKSMLDSGLANEDPLSGAGAAKVRVRLAKNASEILDRSDDSRVRRFWELIG